MHQNKRRSNNKVVFSLVIISLFFHPKPFRLYFIHLFDQFGTAHHMRNVDVTFFSVALLVTDSIMFYSDYVIHYYHACMSLFFISHCYSLSAASAFVFVSLHLWTLSLWIIVYHLCISWWRFDKCFSGKYGSIWGASLVWF